MTDRLQLFRELSAIMRPYAKALDCKADSATELYLDTRHIQKNKKPLFFGAVQAKKSYVSYHLMPLYTDPDLLESVSPELRSRMQGKSCFNFAALDPSLVEQLAALTDAAFARYRKNGFV